MSTCQVNEEGGRYASNELEQATSRPSPPISARLTAMELYLDNVRLVDMLIQPDSRPMSQEHLAAEVRPIYAGLTMVESKCIHVDKAQATAMRMTGSPSIGKQLRGQTIESTHTDDHWSTLVALPPRNSTRASRNLLTGLTFKTTPTGKRCSLPAHSFTRSSRLLP